MYRKIIFLYITLLASSGIKASQKGFAILGSRCKNVTCEPGYSKETVSSVVANWARKKFMIMPKTILLLVAKFLPNRPITRLSVCLPDQSNYNDYLQTIHQVIFEGKYTPQELKEFCQFKSNSYYIPSSREKQLSNFLSYIPKVLTQAYLKQEARSFKFYLLGTWHDFHAMDTTPDKKTSNQLKSYIINRPLATSNRINFCYFPSIPEVLEHMFNIRTNPPYHIFINIFPGENLDLKNNPHLQDQIFKEEHGGQHEIVAFELKENMSFHGLFKERFGFIDQQDKMYYGDNGEKEFLEYYHKLFPKKEESSEGSDCYGTDDSCLYVN